MRDFPQHIIEQWASHRWYELELQAVNAALYGGMAPAEDGYDKQTRKPYTGMLTIRKKLLRAAGWALPGNEEVDSYMQGYHRVLGTAGMEKMMTPMRLPNSEGELVEVSLHRSWASELRSLLREEYAKLDLMERQRWILLARKLAMSSTG